MIQALRRIQCPKCRTAFTPASPLGDDVVPCPNCHARLRIKARSIETPPPEPAPPKLDPLLGDLSNPAHPERGKPPPCPSHEHNNDSRGFTTLLKILTPTPWGTYTIFALNILVFVLMTATGISLFKPQVESLLDWGALHGSPTACNGQWWRLLTSTFLHIGILHIACNLWCFWEVGALTERLYGTGAFLALYVLSGLGASLTALVWKPDHVSAGASGAIFGIYGGLLAFLLFSPKGTIPTSVLKNLKSSSMVFVGLNLLAGYAMVMAGMRIGTEAHLGGLCLGFLVGASLRRSLSEPPTKPAWSWPAASGITLLLLASIWPIRSYVLSDPAVRLRQELFAFDAMERDLALKLLDLLGRDARNVAQEIKDDILPLVDATLKRFNDIPETKRLSKRRTVLTLQSEGLHGLVEAIQEKNETKIKEAKIKLEEAAVAFMKVGVSQ